MGNAFPIGRAYLCRGGPPQSEDQPGTAEGPAEQVAPNASGRAIDIHETQQDDYDLDRRDGHDRGDSDMTLRKIFCGAEADGGDKQEQQPRVARADGVESDHRAPMR